MVAVHPFAALRPLPELASKVAAVPYDVVDRTEAKQLASNNAHSFLHVTKSEIDFGTDVEATDERVYAKARAALEALLTKGWLYREHARCFYAYELTMKDHRQLGLVMCAEVAGYESGSVRRHELTRPEKELDRTRHIEVTGAQTGPVFLVHRDEQQVEALLLQQTRDAPDVDFVADDNVRHRVWTISGKEPIEELKRAFAAVDVLYIADGHHRSAAAARVGRAAREQSRGSSEAERFLAVTFPCSQVQILPYNRVVRDLGGKTAAEVLGQIKQSFTVNPGAPAELQHGVFGMHLGGQWYALQAPERAVSASDPVARLDVSILQELVLAPVLGIEDPRRDERIAFVGGIRGREELERRVNSGDAVAFELPATRMQQVLEVADRGEFMPPKSTWFEPKLRDGLLVHTI